MPCCRGGGDLGTINVSSASDSDSELPLSCSPPSKYHAYECSPTETPFSSDHLRKLTVQGCLDAIVPRVLQNGSVRLIGWSRIEPTASKFILTQASIPSLDDTRVFLGDMSKKFGEGNRSVIVEAKGTV
jgi:hypothetical protein